MNLSIILVIILIVVAVIFWTVGKFIIKKNYAARQEEWEALAQQFNLSFTSKLATNYGHAGVELFSLSGVVNNHQIEIRDIISAFNTDSSNYGRTTIKIDNKYRRFTFLFALLGLFVPVNMIRNSLLKIK